MYSTSQISHTEYTIINTPVIIASVAADVKGAAVLYFIFFVVF